jgi:peptide/nickel transport system permease protein
MKYITRRLISIIPTLFIVSLIIFGLMRILPGDVAQMILMGPEGEGGAARAEDVARIKEQLGLNDPLIVQYFAWMGGMVTLDAGDSLWSGEPIFKELMSRFPLTIELGILATLVSLSIAIPTGVIAAVKQGTWMDYSSRVFAIIGLSVPSFWVGVLTILLLVTYFGWTPPLGYVDFFEDPRKNLQQLIWPALALGYIQAALVSRMTRSSLLEVMREDYIRTARSKGIKESQVVMRHALKNSMLPVITIIGIGLANIIGGTTVIETVFNLPGVGRYMVDAIGRRDYPVVQTLTFLFALIFALANLTVDLIYLKLDPRIRLR